MMSKKIFPLSPGNPYYFDPDFDFLAAVKLAWQFQRNSCPIFKQFIDLFDCDLAPEDYHHLPFLPIESFKYHNIRSGDWHPERIFRSSGTTSGSRSRHMLRSLEEYQRHTINIFENRFGPLRDFVIFALLPNYLEAGDSSLVSMVEGFLKYNGQQQQGFYLHDFDRLKEAIGSTLNAGKKVLFIGVTFALLDFANSFPMDLSTNTIILETGGMKGRGEELTRTELHGFLSSQFKTKNVFSEYGMTELMSQAYADYSGKFWTPPGMKVSIREINDPLSEVRHGKTGVINVIDLANIHTCSFIATSDLGIQHPDGSFEIVGRLDQSDIRGCHLMYLESNL